MRPDISLFREEGMNSLLKFVALGLAALALTACGELQSTPPEPGSGWVESAISEPAIENYRLDLGSGVVVAFVEGLTPEMSEKVAFVTHVPSGSQAVLDATGSSSIDVKGGRTA